MQHCPLTGELCGKKRPYHVTDIKQGQVVCEMDLCEDCIQSLLNQSIPAKHLPPEMAQPLENKPVSQYEASQDVVEFVHKMLQVLSMGSMKKSMYLGENKTCPKCGTSTNHIQKTGKLGCDYCYNMFSLDQLLTHLHGATQHVGKVPKKWQAQQVLQNKGEKLQDIEHHAQEKLIIAIKNEQYEIASQIKGCLHELKQAQQNIEILEMKLREALEQCNEVDVELLQKEIQTTMHRCFEIQTSLLSI